MARVTPVLLIASMALVFSAPIEDPTFTTFKTSVAVAMTSCTPKPSVTAVGDVCVRVRTRMVEADSLASACTVLPTFTICMTSNCAASVNLSEALRGLKSTCDGISSVKTPEAIPTTTAEMDSTKAGSSTIEPGAGVSLTRSHLTACLTLISVCASLLLILE